MNWRLPKDATLGKWTITAVCGRAGAATTSFMVTPRAVAPQPVPARVVVDKSGFSYADTFSSRSMSLGVVLRNVSPDEDALRVQVTVNIVDGSGRILKTNASTISGIPAGSTYYQGDYVFLDYADTPTRLVITVQVGQRQTKKIGALPPTANLRAVDSFGDTRVEGEFSNPYAQTMSTSARITCAVFDNGGNVIGGGFTYPASSVSPGGRIGFSMGIEGVKLVRVATIQCSVEPVS
jgi:hypothetical protein